MAEYFFNIMPCSLCYYERYVMMAIVAFSLGVVIVNYKGKFFTALLYLLAFGGVILCAFHIGVEQKWWAMPQSCIGNAEITSTDPSEMLKSLQEQMKNQKVVRCDKVNWYLFGFPASWWTFLAFLFATMIMAWREWTQPKK
jgi:disulfide bond formation protein DsbB